MITGVLAVARLMEYQQPTPQPRKHKCAVCQKVYECVECTIVIYKKASSSADGLTCMSCSHMAVYQCEECA